MRNLLLAALAALVLAAPAAAQKEPFSPVVTVRYGAHPRAVYIAAFDALEARGVPLRARMLDDGILITQPQFSSNDPGPKETAVVMMVRLEEKGDSTEVVIQAEVVHPDGRPARDDDERLARILEAEIMLSAAMDTALSGLPPGAGAPDPIEESDAYGYGRRNPIQVGGARQTGLANQLRYLDGLRGPAGQPVRYRRLGSCCSFRSEHAPDGGALDAYEVTYDGLDRPRLLYLDFYTPPAGPLPPPEGFTLGSPAAPS